MDRSEHPWHVPADPMVYRPRASRRMGRSRITRPTIGLQDAAVRALIRMEGHMDIYSIPQLLLLGASESIFKNADGSQKASWQIVLGRIKGIPDDEDASNPRADVKQFPAASPQPHLDLFTQQAKTFAGEHDIPVSSLGVQAETNSTTEDGSNNAERNLIAEAEGATDDWSPAVRRALARALAMQNGLTEVPAEWRAIDTKWRSPAFLSRAAQADAGSKVIGSIPWLAETEVGLEVLGMDESQIKRALAERRRNGGSAALRAITEAAAQGRAAVVPSVTTEDAAAIRAKADAMGVLIRSGVDAESAAAAVGFTGMKFTGAVPVSLRLPEADANKLEGGENAPVSDG
ncbi:MAG: phage portal protein [Mycetocola sp.]